MIAARFMAVLLAAAVIGGFATDALAFDGQTTACPARLVAWVERCGRAQSIELSIRYCPAGVVVLNAGAATDDPLPIEIREDGKGFRRIGNLSISPATSFANWDEVAAPRRAAFDKVVACVEAEPKVPFADRTTASFAVGASSWPWRFVLGVLGLSVASVWGFGRSRRRASLRTLAALAALAGVIFVLRRLFVGDAYFHQNGQGPLWVGYAVGHFTPYGPGYAEMFALFARLHPRDPDLGVFRAQTALCALVPVAVWTITRLSGGRAWFSWALTIGVAVQAIPIRLGASESYFGTIGALLFLAAAAVSMAGWMRRPGPLAAAVGAAGFFVAQAARIHPVGWVPAALVPLVALVGPGSLRRRLRVATVCGVGIAGVVALSALRPMLSLIEGPLGQQWMGRAPPGWTGAYEVLRVAAPVFVAVAVAARDLRAVVGAAVIIACGMTCAAFNLLGGLPPWVTGGYVSLHVPAAIAGLAPILARLGRGRAERPSAVLVGVAALVTAIVTWRPLMVRPTDAVELDLAHQWIAQVPSARTVVWIGRAGDRTLALPIYGSSIQPRSLSAEDPEVHFDTRAGSVYYFRGSLCSTTDGRPACTRLEAHYRLETSAEAKLAALPSLIHLNYDSASIPVGLYRLLPAPPDVTP